MQSGRANAIVAGGFVVAVALAVVLLVTDPSHTDSAVAWRQGVALPRSVPVGVTVVDGRIPVRVAPDVAAWTGSELLTFGARGAFSDVGAVYDATTGRWRATSDSPFGAALAGAQAVWTGDRWVVAGVLCSALVAGRNDPAARGCDPGTFVAAAYFPAEDAWRTIERRPFPVGDFFVRGHAPTFGAAIGMLGSRAIFVIDGQYYAFRPDAWDWDWLPQPSPSPSDTRACVVGDALVRYDAADGGVSVLTADAVSWRPSGPRPPDRRHANLRSVCTPDGFVAYTPDLGHVERFDVQRARWSAISSPPPPIEPVGSAMSVAGGVLFHGETQNVFYRLGVADSWNLAAPGLAVAPSRLTWLADGTGIFVANRELRTYRAT